MMAPEIDRLRALLDGREAPEPGPLPALDALVVAFGLSPFERDVLLLAAAPELETDLAITPTFGLALTALPGAHWSALAPGAPLRHWRLVEPAPGHRLTAAPLKVDEAVLHYVAGVPTLDPRLEGLVEPVPAPAELTPSRRALADRLAAAWATEPPPLVHLGGRDAAGRRAVAAAAAADSGLVLCAMRAADIPADARQREELARLWERQAVLGRSALLVEDPEPAALVFAERVGSPLALAGREAPPATKPLLRLDVATPQAQEREQLWREAVGAAEVNGELERVVGQFDLGSDEILAAGVEARTAPDPATALWDACRAQARPRLDDLAQRIEPAGGWGDLVLGEHGRATLQELVLHVRHRALVEDGWGFAAKSSRGLGVSALFTGPSGTGKTLAAEVLAGELRLDLYRIDLSAVVSKYIGETEKNLRRVFDAADSGGAILLFDEADALFGKRTEVKDSHDRYANIEVGYLLQRMEAYRGLAILTTNLKGALDPSFLRRIRFVVQFPRPDEAARREIWRRVFPDRAPVDGLDVAALGRLDVTGGTIRGIAVRAAVLAADAGSPITMAHLATAARAECAKLERPVAEGELASWT